MSRIFDSVHANSSRRKAHVLDGPASRSLFDSPGMPGVMLELGITKPGGGILPVISTGDTGDAVSDDGPFSHFRLLVDGIWLSCILCILIPVCSFVWDAVHAETVNINMTGIPYKCSLFYFGLFVGLPGASVYVFCCTLCFNKRGKIAIFMCMVSIFVFVCTVERKCMTSPSVDTSVDFYMLAISVFSGISSQVVFLTLMQISDARRQSLYVLMGFASVLVLLSVLAVALAGTKFDENFTRASCYISSLPLALALVIYILSTYSSLHPIRSICRNV